jgi:hypothetical protein
LGLSGTFYGFIHIQIDYLLIILLGDAYRNVAGRVGCASALMIASGTRIAACIDPGGPGGI